jgi:hypothetical protein
MVCFGSAHVVAIRILGARPAAVGGLVLVL